MKVAVISDNALKEEWLAQGIRQELQVQWLMTPNAAEDAACYIDLLFDPTSDRINKLKTLQPAIIIVNSVSATLKELPENFIRINGWPGFLKRQIVETSCGNDDLKTSAEKIFSLFNKTTEWVTDWPGFITARVISMIINEAYFTLEEKVSGKKEIDLAMKLGTNYPFGPFEWGEKIGLMKIYELLKTLAINNPRYQPAPLLTKEASLYEPDIKY